MQIAIHNEAKALRNGLKNAKVFPHQKELVSLLESQGHHVKIIQGILSWEEMHSILQWCDTWIGVDSFWQHFAWYYKKPGIAIFSQSDPLIFGHPENVNLLKDRKYLRENQFDIWEGVPYKEEAFPSAEFVVKALRFKKSFL